MKILLAIDGSQFSEAATQVLSAQLRPEGSEVLLVHVIEAAAFFEQDAGLQERQHRAEKFMTHAAETLHAAGFQKVHAPRRRRRAAHGHSGSCI